MTRAKQPVSASSTWPPKRPGAARATAPPTTAAWPTWVGSTGIEDEPTGDSADIAALLESAEEAVNEVAPGVLADVLAEEAKRDRAAGRWWRKKR
jgi:hypothetical protein